MEQSLTLDSSRNFTCPKQLLATDNSDKISTLPDAVLSHILSLVPTKDAVRTSILSKRWEEVWLSIPHYEFDGTSHKDNDLLINLLNKLNHHDTIINKLFISCCPLHEKYLLHAISCNVKELNLSLSEFKGPFIFPSSTYFIDNLVSLKLNLSYSVLIIPSYLKFSRLKTLHFECILFRTDSSIEHLLLNCCLLKHLAIEKCQWKINCVFDAPKLTSLIIHEELREYFAINNNAIIIIGPALQFFEYKGGLMNAYSLIEPLSLVVVDIDVADRPRLFDNDQIVALRAFALLSKLKNATCLKLTSDTIAVIFNYSQECRMKWPTFKNLIKLEIIEATLNMTYISLLTILCETECLQSLSFPKGIYVTYDEVYEEQGSDTFYESFLSDLRHISIGAFCGHPRALFLVEFFLTHAIVLERMVKSFSADKWADYYSPESVYAKILSLPRGSESCRIEFS